MAIAGDSRHCSTIFYSMIIFSITTLMYLCTTEVESHVLLDEVLPWAVLAPFGQNNIASALSQVASNFPYLLTVMACGYFPLRWTRNYFENMDYFGSNFH
ncbi:hypothetical protein MPTK1_1g23395 [Marchantia polymorpha subsp. ruderalis]